MRLSHQLLRIRIIKSIFGFALFSALLTSSVQADQAAPELDNLFKQLQQLDSNEVVEAAAISEKIWQHWNQHSNPLAETAVKLSIKFVATGQDHLALSALNRAIKIAPDFAEAWNKRAVVYYLRGDYQLATNDIIRTLELEPRHFGALAGQAYILESANSIDSATTLFERALSLNPFLTDVQSKLSRLLVNKKPL